MRETFFGFASNRLSEVSHSVRPLQRIHFRAHAQKSFAHIGACSRNPHLVIWSSNFLLDAARDETMLQVVLLLGGRLPYRVQCNVVVCDYQALR